MVTVIRLTEQEEKALEQVGTAKHVSIEQLIEQSIQNLIRSHLPAQHPPEAEMAERRRRAIAISGLYDPQETNLSTNHDEYLTEDFAE